MSNYHPRQRAYGYRRRSSFFADYGFAIFFAIVLVIALINGARLLNQWGDCSNAHGKMVQGLSTTGYVCVDKDK
jgi:hypothetical protein